MENDRKSSGLKIGMTIIITALITCVLTTITVYNYLMVRIGVSGKENVIGTALNNIVVNLSNKETTSELISANINNKFIDIKSKLNDIYIGDLNEEKMIENALEGYVAGVGDEYTEYLNEDEVKSLMQSVNGSYVGVGLYIANNTSTNEILVVGVFDDSPAEEAGILVGDVIKKVNGKEYTGEQVTEASNSMKGVEGTRALVTIEREGKQIEFDITRKTIKFKYIKSEKLKNDIGYIRISAFDGGCAKDFKEAYNQLQSQGIKSLIIDLRNNGGGIVDESLEIAKLIVPNGAKMLITKDKEGKEDISTSNQDPIINVPIVILVNGYTASASEILTAAIRENVDCKVVGTQTYGKGVIQGIFLFDDKKTGLKITMQEYFTPKNNKINKIGITPDEVVELPDSVKNVNVVEESEDTQLNKAIEILKNK